MYACFVECTRVIVAYQLTFPHSYPIPNPSPLAFFSVLGAPFVVLFARYADLGSTCSSAMAEFQCRAVFPAMFNGSIAPVTFDSCVDLFTACVGDDDAVTFCRSAGPGSVGGLAAVAPPESPWPTVALPSLRKAEADASSNNHSTCTLAKAARNQWSVSGEKATQQSKVALLPGCPSKTGKMVRVNSDIWSNASHIDGWIVKKLASTKSQAADPSSPLARNASSQCAEVLRTQLCHMHMPECNMQGGPIKMTYVKERVWLFSCDNSHVLTVLFVAVAAAVDPVSLQVDTCTNVLLLRLRLFR